MRILILAALLLPGVAMSAPVVLTWTNPTQNTDGSALALSSITRSRTEYGSCGGTATNPTFNVKAGEQIQNTNAATVTIERPVGTHCFRTAVTTSNGQESGLSNVARVVLTAPTVPNPPTNLTVQTDQTAFVIVKSRDRLAMVPVGTVALGTACDTSQPVLGRYVVPRSAVTFVSSVTDEVVFASCS